MAVNVVVDLLLGALCLSIQMSHELAQCLSHRLGVSSFESIDLWLSSLDQILEMSSQGLEFPQMHRWRRPGSGSLLFTETTNQSRIRAIILVAAQLALAESFDLDWVDDAHSVALLVEVKRQGFT